MAGARTSPAATIHRWQPKDAHSQRIDVGPWPAGKFRYAEQIHPETTKTSTMTNTRPRLQNLATSRSTGPLPNNLDATRGAAQLGIASQVWVHHDVVDSYSELDPGVGRNVVGAVLAVLDCHLACGGSFAGSEVLPVCLRRREDGQPVEVDLLVRRLRSSGRECLAITATGERSAEL
jgi:hypothetical protein